ncbi:MAG: hypothetical protein IKS07_05780 [Lachnospiraceae bacterium]|nr:hypothetical protein [Lachnospiraceae bacterium]
MKKASKRTRIALACAALLATAAGLVKAVYISLDIDESYLVACAYRIASGDRIFSEMWEPHQLASLIPSLFVRVWMALAGTTEGLVLFLRVWSVLIHVAVGAALYRFLTRRTRKSVAFVLLLLHLNFLPKWVQSLDFELMSYWAVLGCCLILFSACEKPSRGTLPCFAAGVLLLVSMLSYPTLILLYPVYLAGILLVSDRSVRISKAVCFTLGALLPGLFVLALICRSVPSGGFFAGILRVFANPSHATQPFFRRMAEYALDGGKALLLWGGIVLTVHALCRMLRRGMEPLPLPFSMLIAFFILQAVMIAGCVFFDRNQFFLQGRYAAILLPGLLLSVRKKGVRSGLLWFAFLPGIFSVLSVLTVTNMNAGTAWSKAMPAVLASVYVLLTQYPEEDRGVMSRASLAAALALLAGLFLCRLGLIRVTGCLPVTIHADFAKVTHGPARGLYLTRPFAEAADREYEALQGLYGPETRVLYVGAEMLLYLDCPCVIASPSVEGTTIYDSYFLTYYEAHPERLPEIVVYDRHYSEFPEYARYPQEYIIDEWISQHYRTLLLETPDLLVYGS